MPNCLNFLSSLWSSRIEFFLYSYCLRLYLQLQSASGKERCPIDVLLPSWTLRKTKSPYVCESVRLRFRTSLSYTSGQRSVPQPRSKNMVRKKAHTHFTPQIFFPPINRKLQKIEKMDGLKASLYFSSRFFISRFIECTQSRSYPLLASHRLLVSPQLSITERSDHITTLDYCKFRSLELCHLSICEFKAFNLVG